MIKHNLPRGYPVSTDGLSPIRRCIDLRQRAMFAKPRHPMRLMEQMIENLIGKLNRNGFTACGGWNGETGDGDICVCQIGGGYHRDNWGRRYDLKGGHVVAIGRDRP